MALILSLNSGSSSCKVQLFDMPSEKVICNGLFERIGLPDGLVKLEFNGDQIKLTQDLENHEKALELFFELLQKHQVIKSLQDIKAVGHRVVHGGEKYNHSVIITEEVSQDILEYGKLAPLHNPANHLGYVVIKKLLPEVMQVAVFDTAFHQTIKPATYMYPIPRKYYDKYKIRKYGFHGTSHYFVSQQAIAKLGKDNSSRLICCHLGNGASISAIKNGQCINTSMGFTPLAGIMMGTRSGDIDPAIIPFMENAENLTPDQTLDIFNRQSGLLGVSGRSSDMRDIQKGIEENDSQAILAMDMYVERIALTIGSYITQLGGCDAILFTAGVGENASTVRKAILDYLKPAFNVVVDEKANQQRGPYLLISSKESSIKALVIATNEELMIAKDTFDFYQKEGN